MIEKWNEGEIEFYFQTGFFAGGKIKSDSNSKNFHCDVVSESEILRF